MLACNWMGIPLRSPLVLASLSLCSKPDVRKHIEYFEHAIEYGVGAIILPSIHPLRADESIGEPHVRTAIISSGLHTDKDCMGFAVLGATDNIASIDYGLALAEEAAKLGVPILGSVANIGSEADFLNVVHRLTAIKGVSGLELNFSCPNVQNGLNLSVELLKKVQNESKNQLPITIKLAPKEMYDFLLNDQQLFQGVTLSNAYTGLVPPMVATNQLSPFGDMEYWRPTGVYGPQEKAMTFYDIWNFKTNTKAGHLQLSSVGGFVNGDDVIQAVMLGADCVQLSSAVFWNGLSIIHKCNSRLISFLNQNDLTLEQLKGMGLNRIKESDDEMPSGRPMRKMRVNSEKCMNCMDCACVERGCYAFRRNGNSTQPIIDSALCSGCGWCQRMCRFGAVDPY